MTDSEILQEAKNAFGERGYEEFDDLYWLMFAQKVREGVIEECAKKCDELQKNYARYYRTKDRGVGGEGYPYDPAHCALALREMGKRHDG